MDYNLTEYQKSSTTAAFRKMLQFMKEEKRPLLLAFFIMLLNAGIAMLAPYLIGYTIDHYIQTGEYKGLFLYSGILLVLYIIWAGTEYGQTKLMGTIGQNMLYSLRKSVFDRLQQLPVAFFNQNKAGDLISRINNDTDKVNQFFSQSLMRFADSIFTMTAAGIFLLCIQVNLGGAALAPAVFILIFVRIVAPIVKRKNAASMRSTGDLSAEIQESLANFKTIVAFNRRDYFRKKFQKANLDNYQTSVSAGLWNNIFMPVFTLFSNIAQLIVLSFGIYLIIQGNFTIGLLISFLAYTRAFYQPLRQLAALWASFQTAMAAWDRISVILRLESDLPQIQDSAPEPLTPPLLCFDNVAFQYPNGREVLRSVSFQMETGKTYALVGPTGGGKTTTASLIARLYDPTSGIVRYKGKDIRSYSPEVLSKQIGFILQDPFLFNGTVMENIIYGNEHYQSATSEELMEVMAQQGFTDLLQRFENGLDTVVTSGGNALSLGEKQLIAFIRAVLRQPDLLILDEATANIDTVTEQLLEAVLLRLPAHTTRVIIAHRLNTIENADEIFFVNAGALTPAGSFDNALALLLERQRDS